MRAGRIGRSHAQPWLLLLFSVLVACSAEPEPAPEPARLRAPDRSATEPAPRTDREFRMRHAEINSLPRRGEIELVFLGDSITQKWRAEGSYVWRKRYIPRRAANLGINGDRTEHVLWRLQNGNLDGMDPKLVVLLIGTNNLIFDGPDRIAAGVLAIVSELRRRLPRTRILLLGVLPRAHRPEHRARQVLTAVNARLEAAADGEVVLYRDIGAELLLSDGTLPPEIMPDFLHLSARGYSIWANAIEKDIAELLGEVGAPE